jgi:hypothetical protein
VTPPVARKHGSSGIFNFFLRRVAITGDFKLIVGAIHVSSYRDEIFLARSARVTRATGRAGGGQDNQAACGLNVSAWTWQQAGRHATFAIGL